MSADYITTLGLTKQLLDKYAKQHSTHFPSGSKVHYDAVLVSTHKYLNEHVHPHVQPRGELHDAGIYLTDHGPKHVELVMRRASQLVRTAKSLTNHARRDAYETCLMPYEIFLLAMAIHFHDVGNMYGREGHEQRIIEEMQKVGPLAIPLHQKTLIGRIAACHGGTIDGDKDTIKHLPIGGDSDGEAAYRPRLLAAVLRLADELADEHSRADNYGLINRDDLPETCLLFHKYAEGLKVSIDIIAGYVSLQFSLYETDLKSPFKQKSKRGRIKEKFLLDEIYERTLKTYVEMQYCEKYMRELDARLHEVRVEIIVYPHRNTSTQTGHFSYTIGDTGYPDYRGREREALLKLARNFEHVPDGRQVADKLSHNQPLPFI